MTEHGKRLFVRILVMRCQLGDDDAFRQLVERFNPRLHYFVRKLLLEQGAVNDIVQEVWLDVFRQLPKLKNAGAFSTWIYRIARGKAALHLRRDQAASTVALCDEDIAASDQSDEPEPGVDLEQLHAALDQLNLEHREVLVLRFLEDLSYEEISQVVQCPIGTVRSRLHFAKRALKQILKPNREFKT